MFIDRADAKDIHARATDGGTVIGVLSGVMAGALPSLAPLVLPSVAVNKYFGPYGETYFRIWVSPRDYAVTAIAPGAEFEIGVWNAYDKPNSLTALNASEPGFEMVGALPTTFQEYQYRKLKFKATDDAPAAGVIRLTFTFTVGAGIANLSVKLAELFKTIPDDGVTESWQWLTAIHESADGTERRAQMRFYPRISFQFSMTIPDDQERARQFGQLWKYLATPAIFPLLHKRAPLTERAGATDTRLHFDPILADVRAGENAVLYDPYTDAMALITIQELHSDGATIKDAPGASYGENWHIVPALKLRIPDGSGLSMSHIDGKLSVAAEAIEPRNVDIAGYVLPEFDGLPLVPYAPLGDGSNDENFTQAIETRDGGILVPDTYTEQGAPKVDGRREFFINRGVGDEWIFWTAFAERVRGSLKPFLISTSRHDLEIVELPIVGNQDLIIRDNGYDKQFEKLNRVQLVTDTGAVNTTVMAVFAGIPGTLTVRLADALTTDKINRVSILQKVRLADDEISMVTYHEHTLISINVRTVDE